MDATRKMIVRYDATDEALLASGLEEKFLRQPKEPYLRSGAVDLDLGYLVSVWEARERRDLEALSVNNPGIAVAYPPHAPRMGLVPDMPQRAFMAEDAGG